VNDGSRTELDCQTHPEWEGLEISSLLSDAHLLMRDYQTPISLSALQVYHSGVATMPECGLRKKSANFHTANLISQRDRGWQTEMTILYGHTDCVSSAAFSSDGLRIVSGSQDKTVRIWDAVSGTTQHTLEGHTSYVLSVAFSSDGLCIVSGSYDNTVRIWDAVSGTTQHTLEGHTSYVNSVAFSSDGLCIVSGSHDNTVRIWDAMSGTIQQTLESHTSMAYSVAFSSDGLHVVSGSYDGTVRIWDANTGAMQHILDEYQAWQSLRSFLAASALRNGWHIFKAPYLPSTHYSHYLTEIMITQDGSSAASNLDVNEGWVFRVEPDGTHRRLCWLPHKRWHNRRIACWGQKAVIGAASGVVTILDFSAV
jgi:WD40 repeat protein